MYSFQIRSNRIIYCMSHRRDDGGYQPTSPSEMSVSFQETTRRNILEDSHLHTS